jgi:AraC-like DNA-binding protein
MTHGNDVGHFERRVLSGEIRARQPHALRRITAFAPALCRIRHGEKQIAWQGRTQRAGTGQLVLMPAGVEMDICNLPGAHGYHAEVITLSAALIQRFRTHHGALVDALLAQPGDGELCVTPARHVASAWDELQSRLATGAPAELLTHYGEGLLLALTLTGHAAPLLLDRRDPLCDRVQQLLLLDPAAPWTVERIAQRLNLGASTLRRQLSLEGRSFRDILEEVRLGWALQLLQTTRTPIGDIAASSGYASPSRFAVRFRQHYGLSPRELRAAL